MNFSLSKLYPIINIDGEKLAVDFSSYSIFIWNDYATEGSSWKNCKYNSCWVVFKNIKKNIFLKFLAGNISFHNLFTKFEYEFAFLKTDLDTIVIDKDFTFDIAFPDEDTFLLKEETQTIIPENECSFGHKDHFSIHTISFGDVHTNFSVKIEGFDIESAIKKLNNKAEWISFLDELGKNYTRLLYDENYILNYSSKAWNENPSPVLPHTVFKWLPRDGFDYCLNKKYKYDFFIYRKGNNFELFNGKDFVSINYSIMSKAINLLGENLYQVLNCSKSKKIGNTWLQRNKPITSEEIITMSTGLNDAYPRSISFIKRYSDEPFKAAARLSRSQLSDEEMVAILEMIKEENSRADNDSIGNTLLQFITSNVPATVFNSKYKFYEQGYFLAEYLRSVLGIEEKVDSVKFLFSKFGVDVTERDFNPKIYALSLWSNDNILVLLNIHNEALGHNNNLIRTTLAHELAHVLVDRRGALPVTEVLLSDPTYDPIERRARAFAAELLLPRRLARNYADMHSTPDLAALAQEYEVSDIVAAQQIVNATHNIENFNPEWKTVATNYIITHKGPF